MRDRPPASAARPVRRATLSVDVVLLAPRERRLTVLLVRNPKARGRERWELPWGTPRAGETLDGAAARIAHAALGAAPSFMEQVRAFGCARRHPGGADISVAFLGLVSRSEAEPAGAGTVWAPATELPAIPARQRVMVDDTLAAVRARLDLAPIAFHLLPAAFTLSELQEIYELLLGRRLHKASFRRALHAAGLVEPTDEWRTEGRGRPAQLFRYAPRKRRRGRRRVRFEWS